MQHFVVETAVAFSNIFEDNFAGKKKLCKRVPTRLNAARSFTEVAVGKQSFQNFFLLLLLVVLLMK